MTRRWWVILILMIVLTGMQVAAQEDDFDDTVPPTADDWESIPPVSPVPETSDPLPDATVTPMPERTSPPVPVKTAAPRTTPHPKPAIPPQTSSRLPPTLEQAGFKGRFHLTGGFDTKQDYAIEDTSEYRGILYLENRYSITPFLRSTLSGFVDYSVRSSEEGSRHLQEYHLQEAYLELSRRWMDLRFGSMVVSWGRADSLGPTDNLNPTDMRWLEVEEPEWSRVPVTMLESRFYFTPFTLDLVYIPFYEPNRFDLFGTDRALFRQEFFDIALDWADLPAPFEEMRGYERFEELFLSTDPQVQAALNEIFLGQAYPPADFQNGDYGIRLAGSSGGVDLSLSYLLTYDDLPVVRLDEGLREIVSDRLITGEEFLEILLNKYRFRLEADRYQQFGADLALVVGDFGFRWEGAYYVGRQIYSEDLAVHEVNMGVSNLGLDILFGPEVYANVQLVQAFINDNPQNSLLETRTHLVTTEIRKPFWDWHLEAKLSIAYNFTMEDMYIEPRLVWKASDFLRLTTGVRWFDGEEDTLFGAMNRNDEVYFVLDVIF